MPSETRYLVTGASSYIGMHVVEQLLGQGHHVRASIRNLKHKEKVNALKKLGGLVEVIEADLSDPEAWHRAVHDIDVVIHLAFNITVDEDSIVQTAIDGMIFTCLVKIEHFYLIHFIN